MKIEFDPFQSTINELAIKLAMILFFPLIIALIVGFILQALKVPRLIVQPIAIIIYLISVYQMFVFLYG